MFIGRGLDTDGDGGDDIFVFSRVDSRGMGCVVFVLLPILMAIAVGAIWLQQWREENPRQWERLLDVVGVALCGVAGLFCAYLALRGAKVASTGFGLKKGLIYSVVIMLLGLGIVIRSCGRGASDVGPGAESHAVEESEQDRLNRQHQENLKVIFGDSKK